VDFQEFLTWWNNPDKKVGGPENQNKLRVLKMRLGSQSALAAASSITATLVKSTSPLFPLSSLLEIIKNNKNEYNNKSCSIPPAADAAKKVDEDRSNVNNKINIGSFGDARSSLHLAYAHSDEEGTATQLLSIFHKY
jgi:hypothetical protein